MNGLIPREALTDAQRVEMYALLDAHFAGVTRERFDRDLLEKNWVIEIRRDGRLVGFSTLLARKGNDEDQPILILYSGDTIVAPEAWRSPMLARTWIAAVNELRAGFPERRCYWLLLSSGFRTYRFLPLFWREFFPHYNVPTPPSAQRLLEDLARSQYGTCFDSASGVVRFAQPQVLRNGLATVRPGRIVDPHIAFFLSRNPGHLKGDELVCLAEISETNLTRAGRRMVAP